MATHVHQTVTSFICAGNYAAIVNHWMIVDPVSANQWTLAKDLLEGLQQVAGPNQFLTTMATILSQDSFISSVRVRQVSPVSGQTAVKIFTDSDFPGGVAADLDAAQVAACIIWVTAGNEGLSGRNFIPGVPETFYTNGRITDVGLAAIDDAIDHFVAPITTAQGEWNLALKFGLVPTFAEITHGYLSPTAGTQRRRLVPF